MKHISLTRKQRSLLEILEDGFLLVTPSGDFGRLMWWEEAPQKWPKDGSFIVNTMSCERTFIDYPLPGFDFITYENSPWRVKDLLELPVEEEGAT